MRRSIAIILLAILPVLVLATVWFPPISKYWHWSAKPDRQLVIRLRSSPNDAVLSELARTPLRVGPSAHLDSARDSANRLLAGNLVVAGEPAYRLSARFSAEELLRAPPSMELAVAGMTVPGVLLRAFADTKDARYLSAAAAYVSDWAEFERALYVPKALIWNDHAIAARAVVLTELWYRYRSQPAPLYDPEVAARIVDLAHRYGAFLRRDTLYTYRSNHGSMQNLALLVLALAFPELGDAPKWAETGSRRFLEQMDFYLAQDGVITEHSPGYQGFGLEVVGSTLRCLTLLRRPIPSELADRYERAKAYYLQLLRPDGTLPTIGDTGLREPRPLVAVRGQDGGYGPLAQITVVRPEPSTLSSDGGAAIWWNGLDEWPNGRNLNQTMIAWADFPSRVHKHADEMSLDLWTERRQWIGNVGYWPYHLWGRGSAEGWEGSNAPHLAGEGRGSKRTTVPLLGISSSQLAFLELERRTADGFRVRRQVIQRPPNVWVIIDSFEDSTPREVRTIWTIGESIALTRIGSGMFRLEDARGSSLDVFTGGSPGHQVSELTGSREPFAGWRVSGAHSIVPVPALLVRQSSEHGWSWLAIARGGEGLAAGASRPSLEEWRSAEDWRFRIDDAGQALTISRAGKAIRLSQAGDSISFEGTAAAEPAALPGMKRAYETIAAKAPSRWYDDLVAYRLRMSYVLAALLAGQIAFLVAVARFRPHYLTALIAAGALAWTACGFWINFIYFS